MRLVTLSGETPDGVLALVSNDGTRLHRATGLAPSLQAALECWDQTAPALALLAQSPGGEPFDPRACLAPLPRAWQFLDASAFPAHSALMQKAFGLPPIETDKPLMYQGLSHQFLAGHQDVALPDEADFIDFEGEFAVLTSAVRMGASADEAARAIRLIVLLNDWSLRRIAPLEMKTGFGWIQAKPASSIAPIAVTPDELGPAWNDARVCLALEVDYAGAPFGRAQGGAMAFSFGELLAHAAATRNLPAGTVLGSGTVSNIDAAAVGSSCLAERRALEMIATGAAITPFMGFGGRVTMRAHDQAGRNLFGDIDQIIVKGDIA